MQAVIETGSKQYIVKEGDEILVEKLAGEDGADIKIDKVLLVIDNDQIVIGRPVVKNAEVKATLVAQEKGPKKIIFKYRRREQYKRKVGHRQRFSRLKIDKISL